MEIQSKLIQTVTPIAGNSRMGMTIQDGLTLTEKTLKARRAKRKAQRAARKKNR